MYFVADKHDRMTNVFTWSDPRRSSYSGEVISNVTLDYAPETVHQWPDGADEPEACLGRDRRDPMHFKVFPNRRDLDAAGFDPVPGDVAVFGSWIDYLKLRRAEDLPVDIWFDELDRVDEAARIRRQRADEPDEPQSSARDDVAAWLARSQFLVDASLREIWYLPTDAPADEIRFLAINDRVVRSNWIIQPFVSGVDVAGAEFRSLIADITTGEFARIQEQSLPLPSGWTLTGARHWRRGE